MKSTLKTPGETRVGDRVLIGDRDDVAEVVGKGRLKASIFLSRKPGLKKRERRTNVTLIFLQLESGQLFEKKCRYRERLRVVKTKGGAS